jgi:uroporphyrinogen III methyltransferase/synthase
LPAERAQGRVYLVGAGPGDPGLLTRRAEQCLAAADVVVHDYLVGPRLLAGVRADAEVIALGRAARPTQSDIDALLVDRARAGKTVVRLKNGDPFLLGRGAEEAELLRSAGVPFEVVPGVSAAVAVPAYAGIPVTHRERASLVTIATGHQALGEVEAEGSPPSLPWDALARQGGTLVFLMGMRQVAAIMEALVTHGLARDTPAAVVQWGTTGRQVTVVATAGTLAGEVKRAGLGPPGVIVVGSVVGLREHVRWFEARPLFGRRIVVTRPRAQAPALAERLEAEGAEVLLFPTIAIVAAPDAGALERAVAAAGTYDWIIFTSANGVRVFFASFAAAGRDVRALASVRLAAIGPETAAELRARLLEPAVLPDDYRAEGMIAALASEDLTGRRVLLPRAEGARSILPETLRSRGAQVDEVITYRAVAPPDADVAALAEALERGEVDALTFTSSSTVRHFVSLLGAERVQRLVRGGRPVVACIGPVTADTAREVGLDVQVVPERYTVAALTEALVGHFCNAGGDRLCEEER